MEARTYTNIFEIEGLEQLNAKYRLYQILGLNTTSEEYDTDTQFIISKLSYQLESPVTVISYNKTPHLVIKEDDVIPIVPERMELSRGSIVRFSPTEQSLNLDFQNPDTEQKNICLRFLNFALQGNLRRYKRDLWSPGSGKPFFFKKARKEGNINIFPGFRARVVELSNGKFGISIDATFKYVARDSLPTKLSHESFQKIKGNKVIYHYGNTWYEFRCDHLSDLNASLYEYSNPRNRSQLISLIDDIKQSVKGVIPYELSTLSDECSVVTYRNNKGYERAAPTALCYLTYDTEHPRIKRLHEISIAPPHERWFKMKDAWGFMKNFKYGNISLQIKSMPFNQPLKRFNPPKLEFGNNYILPSEGFNGLAGIDQLRDYARERKKLISAYEAGVFSQDRLPNQYFIIPQSIKDSCWEAFFSDLSVRANNMLAHADFRPKIITYKDNVPKTFAKQALAIREKIREAGINGCSAVVMIHDINDKKKREEDQLANYVIRHLREQDIQGAVIHTSTILECYEEYTDYNGDLTYQIRSRKKGKMLGYLDGVALNKILIVNRIYPFVLADPLNADLIIGIDVKNKTASYTFIDKYARNTAPFFHNSNQKERLSKVQVDNMFYSKIKDISSRLDYKIQRIVIHRDGRLYYQEKDGINEAINELAKNGYISPNPEVTFIEIPKSTAASYRLLNIGMKNGRERIYNPTIGTYEILNEREGLICNTGYPFRHKGTTKPLFIKKNSGKMPMKDVLQDIFYLANLAYTKPDDCSRVPLSIKMNDIILNIVASEYDEDKLQFAKIDK